MIGLCGLHDRPQQRGHLHSSWDSQEAGILSSSLGQEWRAQAQAQAMNLAPWEMASRGHGWRCNKNIAATGLQLVITRQVLKKKFQTNQFKKPTQLQY